jgi:general secretion pathway protein M
MNWMKVHKSSAVLVTLTMVLPLLLVLYLFVSLWAQRAGYQGEIDRLQPRIARLSGLAAAEGELQASAGQVDSTVHALAYPASVSTNSASATLQKEVRRLLADAGMNVSNSQVLPTRDLAGLEQMVVKLRASGDLAALDRFLAKLDSYQPLVLVESVDISPVRQSRRAKTEVQAISVNLQVMTFKVGLDEA